MKYLLPLIFVSISHWFFAQQFATWGTEFWIPNFDGFVTVETDQAATITVEDLANGSINTFSYAGNSQNTINMNNVSLYNQLDPYGNFTAIEKAIKITSDEPINIRYSFGSHVGGGSSMIFPRSSLGTNYTLSTHHLEAPILYNQTSMVAMFFVTATEDNTLIDLNLTHPTENGFPVNTPFSVTLNQGEILQIRGPFCSVDDPATGCYSSAGIDVNNDFSGSTISARSPDCAPISVHYYTGGYLNYVDVYGSGGCCSDRMMEQYLPEKYWGNEFYVIPEQHVPHGNLVKIFSRFDNNDVFVNGVLETTLNANETFNTLLSNSAYVKTTKQSQVSQYFLSCGSALVPNQAPLPHTDPEVTFVLPIQYQSTSAKFGFPDVVYDMANEDNWLSIVVKTNEIQDVVLNGTPLNPGDFSPFISPSPYSWAYIQLSNSEHEIFSNSSSFQAMVICNEEAASRVSYLGINASQDSQNQAEVICYEDEPITLSAPESAPDILWSTNDTSTTIEVNTAGMYSVEGLDSCGNQQFYQEYLITYDCDEFSSPNISCVDDNLNVPNVFTPNADNANDQFVYQLPDCLKDSEFSIVNRWGNKVYTSDQLDLNWDGFVNNSPASDGTYFWTLEGIDYSDEPVKASGFITIAR